MRRFFLLAALLIARTATAQDAGARLGPQFIRYSLGAPTNQTISEMAVPVFGYMQLGRLLTIDVGTAFASASVTSTSSGGQAIESKISGLTDTQIRGTLNLGSDFLLLTAGVNVPTGSSTATPAEQPAAALIGNDFLVFPISSMGSGFGGTGGLAIAHPFNDWNVGGGVSLRHSLPFDPFEDATGAKLRYTPGDEVRVRLGVDHPLGTGRVSVGMTYSKFTDDNIAGSIYNTGNRLLLQGYVNNSIGTGDYVLSAWNLFRASGTFANGTPSGKENITDFSAAYGIPIGEARLEPGVDVRLWTQATASTSLATTLSLRYERSFDRLAIVPSAGFTIGKTAATDAAGVSTTASLSGFRGQLTIRLH